ncbi:MAG: ABC transporter ATP-binding protein [Cyclobacteriaceae bacterium]|nr:MAG: ABC transporter ATP-binding protein [Cyclobacteriaceae bacterium]
MTRVLHAKNITKYFYDPEKFQVLKNIELEVERGEFLSLVGKSGCGKSTLMYVLSTMDTDYEGELQIADEWLTGRSQNELARFRNRHIGFVFQFHYLLPEFTVLQNVMIPALKLGELTTAEIEDRAIEKLGLLGMAEHARKKTNKLSGGQQQRVAIARALINNPDILMGDEPTGNLDSHNSGIVFDIFRELTSIHKQTIIAVTHDEEFAQKTDRVVEMSDGRIIKS